MSFFSNRPVKRRAFFFLFAFSVAGCGDSPPDGTAGSRNRTIGQR